MADDFILLREYVEHGSEDAFRTLVERHSRMVFGTATRILSNAAAAEEVTQAVFILLARKAASIRPQTILAGWLYHAACFAAREALRSETRRKDREYQSVEMNVSHDSCWMKISPLLDMAIARLNASDRHAIVLRFLEDRSFAEVAVALGTSEPAAKMRVTRALERLRALLGREGVTITTAAVLATTLSSNGSPLISQSFQSSLAAAGLSGNATTQTSLTALEGGLRVMAWNTYRKSAVALALVILLGGGVAFVALNVIKKPGIAVTTFAPMAGEWAGTFEMSGDAMSEPVRQGAALSIRSDGNGRSCQIEMRVLAREGRVVQVYRFTHILNERGDRIVTIDDPNIARPLGEGVVTASDQGDSQQWRAGFHAVLPDGGGSMDCEWSRRGDELTIVRRDHSPAAQGGNGTLVSTLRLRRVGA